MDSGVVGIFVLLFIIGWLVSGFVAAMVWQSKGGSFGAGFALGAFLGYLGLFYVAFAQPQNPTTAVDTRGPSTSFGSKTCPRCAEDVKLAAKVCRFCGYEFPEKVMKVPEPLAAAAEEYQGQEIHDVITHAFGVQWGKTDDGRIVYKPKDSAGWLVYDHVATSLVPPRDHRPAGAS